MAWGRKDNNDSDEQQDCGACGGQGGKWETHDGQTQGKSHQRWVACQACGGSGKV